MTKLVERLVEIQQAEGSSDAAFSARMRVNRSTWNLVRRGKRRPSRPLLEGAIRLWPELASLYAQSLHCGGAMA